MYKVKLIELINAAPFLQKVEEVEMPVKLTYSFVKIKKIFDENYAFYLGAIRQLVNKNVQRTEDGNGFQMTEDHLDFIYYNDECKENFKKASAELDSIEVTIDDDKLLLSDLENVNLTFNEVKILFPFIEN